jgi:hypothetical protein
MEYGVGRYGVCNAQQTLIRERSGSEDGRDGGREDREGRDDREVRDMWQWLIIIKLK